jgi:hypothetical protein
MDEPRIESPPETPVALWNPNAAAGWSILFTPLFGAYLHMLNWRALGDTEQEQASLRWVYAGVLFIVALLLIDGTALDHTKGDALTRTIEFFFLVAWYFMSAHAQAKAVKSRFGAGYAHKSWRTPLLAALAGFGLYVAVTIAIAAAIGIRNL